jgi:glutaredoxin
MKITIYTITNCEFSKQEKEYLKSHNLPFDERNLETNREFLTEMMTVGNNFAGTPVTKIEKDDGKIEILKGFTPGEFNKALGFEEKPAETPITPAATPTMQAAESIISVPTVLDKPTPASETPPKAPEPPTAELNSILADLQNAQRATAETPAPTPVAAEPVAPVTPPASEQPIVPPTPSVTSPTETPPSTTPPPVVPDFKT